MSVLTAFDATLHFFFAAGIANANLPTGPIIAAVEPQRAHFAKFKPR